MMSAMAAHDHNNGTENLTADRLVRQALSTLALPGPRTDVQIQRLCSLIERQYGQCGPLTRRACADTLSGYPTLSRSLVERICLDEPLISARFLGQAKAIDGAMLQALLPRMTVSHRRALAQRSDLPAAVMRQLMLSAERNDAHVIADNTDEPSLPHRRGTMPQSEFHDILNACEARDLTTLCAILSRKLSITPQSAFVLLADKRSSNLLIALKYIGMSADDAWLVYTLLSPASAHNERLRQAFDQTFDYYDAEQCSAAVKSWIAEDLAGEARKPVAVNDTVPADQVTRQEPDPIDTVVDLLKAG